MYRTCIYCNHNLGTNEVVEAFPVGRRLAFDAAKGRLWVVCRKCERWNLTPLDERWEAVEDCERRFRETRLRVSTDNIGLAKLREGLELVRIGVPLRPEFAAWRYGDQFGRRRRNTIMMGAGLLTVVAAVAAGGIATGVITGGAWHLYNLVQPAWSTYKKRRLIARVPVKNGKPLTVRGKHVDEARLVPDGNELGWRLDLRHAAGYAALTGRGAISAAGLIMPKVNVGGASRSRVQDAVKRIEESGDPAKFLQSVAHEADHARRNAERTGSKKETGVIPQLALPTRLALEMAVNEENERAAMEGELELLEMAWQEAEEVASIADNLLVPSEVEHQLERLKQGNQGTRGHGNA